MKRISVITLLLLLTSAVTSYSQTQLQLPLAVPESAVLTAPTASAVGSGGSCTAGTHVFAVSFVTAAGDETGIGNGVQVTCVSSDSVSISVIPLGSNNVSARNIYATKAGTTQPFFLVATNTVADNTTTTYTFTLADSSLGAQLTAHATPTPKNLWSLWSNGTFVPIDDNKYILGGSSNRLTNVYTVKLNAGMTVPSGTDTLVGKATTDILTNKTLTAPVLGGSVTGTYTLGGTPTLSSPTINTPTISAPVLSGSTTGTYTLAGTPTITAPTITTATMTGAIQSDYKVLASIATYSATTTAATITGFSWTVVAGTYIFEMNLPTVMTTVGGLTVSYNLATAVLTSIQYQSYAATATDNTTGVSTTGTTTTSNTKVFDSKTAAYTYVKVWGTMVVGTGGTFTWQATQNTSASGGDVTSLSVGGFAKLIRVL